MDELDEKERTPQEMEFILDGITTRMQMAMNSITESSKYALDKMAESNHAMKSAVRWVCITLLLVIIVVSSVIWITYMGGGQTNQPHNGQTVSEVLPGEKVSELRPGTDD